jgi:hypothetical protein
LAHIIACFDQCQLWDPQSKSIEERRRSYAQSDLVVPLLTETSPFDHPLAERSPVSV